MRRQPNPWAREDVIDYVLESYGGTEENSRGIPRRVFIWADEDGDIWIGNSSAFAEHVAELFGFEPLAYDYVVVNRILIDVGERLLPERRRAEGTPAGQMPMVPDKRRARRSRFVWGPGDVRRVEPESVVGSSRTSSEKEVN